MSATFGLNTFVNTPCRHTAREEIAPPTAVASSAKGEVLARSVERPIHTKYAAPAHLTRLNAAPDANSSSVSPDAASRVWHNNPHAIPAADANPARGPNVIPRLSTYKKSGPGRAISASAPAQKSR